MRTKYRLIAFGMVIVFAALACSLSQTDEPEGPSQSELETAVAQTLTALGEEDGGVEPSPTDTPAPEDTPSLPDPHIAYVDDGDLWLWTEAEGAVELYTGEAVEDLIISPDAEVIAFTTIASDFTTLGLWRINADGSGLERLVSAADFDSMASSNPDAVGSSPYLWQFIPETHILAFNTQLHYEGPGLVIQNDLRHLDMDSGSLSVFLGIGDGGNFYYSPDGTKIAFTTPESVNLINSDGTNRMDDVITFPFVRTASEYAFYPVPVWTPDSNEFWVFIPPEDPFGAELENPYELFMVTSEGVTTSIGPFIGPLSHMEAGEKIAPDGSAAAYYESSGDGLNLFIAEIYGPDTPIASNVTSFKGWSPDSSHFLYQTTSGELWLGELGSPPVLFDSWGGPGKLTFVDNNRFVFASGTFGNFTLRLGTIGGGSTLVASPAADFPVFDAVP